MTVRRISRAKPERTHVTAGRVIDVVVPVVGVVIEQVDLDTVIRARHIIENARRHRCHGIHTRRSRSSLLGKLRSGGVGIGVGRSVTGLSGSGIAIGRILLILGTGSGIGAGRAISTRSRTCTIGGICRSFGLGSGSGLLGIGRRLVVGHGGCAHTGDATEHRHGGNDRH